MSQGFCKGTINGKVVKAGGSDKWAWARIEFQEGHMKHPTGLMFQASGDLGSKLAGYNPESPITLNFTIENWKKRVKNDAGDYIDVTDDKGKSVYETRLVVTDIAPSGAPTEDLPF